MGYIKPKTGKCKDCPPDAPEKYIQAGRCVIKPYYHHQNYKRAEAAEKKLKRNKDKRARIAADNNGKTQAQWYADQINMLPKCCEECGEYLNPYHPWGAHVYVAHIVPKRNFESVCVHPYNRMFFCGDCHTDYDSKDSKFILSMKSWPFILARFNSFKDRILQSEYESLQECFFEFI